MAHARALLALLLCSGCAVQFDLSAESAPTLAPTVVVTDAALVDAVSEAARNWNDGTVNGAVVAAPQVILADACGAAPSAWCVTFAPQAQVTATCGADAWGCALTSDTMRVAGVFAVKLPVRTQILVSDSIPKYEAVSTIMHEFGHAFGLEHAPEGLMNPHRSDSERKDPQIDTTTLAAFEALAGSTAAR